jgi:hypothetical protein
MLSAHEQLAANLTARCYRVSAAVPLNAQRRFAARAGGHSARKQRTRPAASGVTALLARVIAAFEPSAAHLLALEMSLIAVVQHQSNHVELAAAAHEPFACFAAIAFAIEDQVARLACAFVATRCTSMNPAIEQSSACFFAAWCLDDFAASSLQHHLAAVARHVAARHFARCAGAWMTQLRA